MLRGGHDNDNGDNNENDDGGDNDGGTDDIDDNNDNNGDNDGFNMILFYSFSIQFSIYPVTDGVGVTPPGYRVRVRGVP